MLHLFSRLWTSHCDTQQQLSYPIASLSFAFFTLKASWMSRLRSPESISGNNACNKDKFLTYFTEQQISFKALPVCRHCRKTAKRKHGIIQNLFLRLQSTSKHDDSGLCAYKSKGIRITLYDNHIITAFDLAKRLHQACCTLVRSFANPR